MPERPSLTPAVAALLMVSGYFAAVHAGEVVRGVDPHGNAARAVLRDGDVIAATTNIIPAAAEYAEPLTIPVKRADK